MFQQQMQKTILCKIFIIKGYSTSVFVNIKERGELKKLKALLNF
jgi:hypothetical protein